MRQFRWSTTLDTVSVQRMVYFKKKPLQHSVLTPAQSTLWLREGLALQPACTSSLSLATQRLRNRGGHRAPSLHSVMDKSRSHRPTHEEWQQMPSVVQLCFSAQTLKNWVHPSLFTEAFYFTGLSANISRAVLLHWCSNFCSILTFMSLLSLSFSFSLFPTPGISLSLTACFCINTLNCV